MHEWFKVWGVVTHSSQAWLLRWPTAGDFFRQGIGKSFCSPTNSDNSCMTSDRYVCQLNFATSFGMLKLSKYFVVELIKLSSSKSSFFFLLSLHPKCGLGLIIASANLQKGPACQSWKKPALHTYIIVIVCLCRWISVQSRGLHLSKSLKRNPTSKI